MPDDANQRCSIFKIIGVPDKFTYILLTLSLILSLAPYIPGADFGIFKIPRFDPSKIRFLKLFGPILFGSLIFLSMPIWKLKGSENSEKLKRSSSNEKGPLNRLESKLDELSRLSPCPFALLGSVYLDLAIGPVQSKILEDSEQIILDPFGIDIGGSVWCVGRFLFIDHKTKSYIYSMVGGKKDRIADLFEDRRKKEWWAKNELTTGPPNSRTAITALLAQPNRKYSSMFTFRGVLSEFTWHHVEKSLYENLRGGGLLYLGGIFKTNLTSGLQDNLRRLNKNCLICVDHGHIASSRNRPQSLEALCEVFRQNLVDIYICSFKDLLILLGHDQQYKDSIGKKSKEKILRNIASKKLLPTITFVRTCITPEELELFVIINSEVHYIEDKTLNKSIDTPTAPKNAFNAAVLNNLVSEKRSYHIDKRIIQAGESGIYFYHKHREKNFHKQKQDD